MLKLALHMTGSYSKILSRCCDYLQDIQLTAICPNWQSFQEARKEPRFKDVDYLYEGFNGIFESIDVVAFCDRYASINLYEVLHVDKSHFKKMLGDYQLRYICSTGQRLAAVFERTRPDYVFFPIIETIDAMLAYRMALFFGARPIVYAHARFASLSFLSESHCELLPSYSEICPVTNEDQRWAINFLEDYRSKPGPFKYRPEFSDDDVYRDVGPKTGVFGRLIQNLWLKSGIERHNRMISFWISFQVYFQRVLLPLRNIIFKLIEKIVIQPASPPPKGFDFFPLHFSPESSINVPAPYFIDQLRVVDRILLDQRNDNRVLVIKEHPAMFGFRGLSFYRALKRRPLVHFVHRGTPSYELIRQARTVYSVTGTACLEAFFFGVQWVQYGENFLSDWARRRAKSGLPVTPEEFICAVRAVSSDFVLYSPGRSAADDRVLFSRKNVEKVCVHIRFHIKMNSRFAPARS
jgi:hypothetical protein